MSTQIDQAFITLWSTEAKRAYQQSESLLRNSIKVVNGVTAKTFSFHKIAKGSVAQTPNRFDELTPLDPGFSEAQATLTEAYAPQWFKDLEAVQTNLDVRAELTKSVTGAINRNLDTQIITAMNANPGSVYNPGGFSNEMTAATITGLAKTLNNNAVPMTDRYLAISAGALEDMMTDTQLANRFYIAYADLLATGQAKNLYGGFNVIVMQDSSLLPANQNSTTGTHRCFAFHREAIGLAVGRDFDLRVDFLPTRVTWQVLGMMLAGAVAIDNPGIVAVDIND